MHEERTHHGWLLPADRPRRADDPEATIMEIWPVIAALSWERQLQGERGAVVMDLDRGAISFRSGAPCLCHGHLVAGYAPRREAVVLVVAEEGLHHACVVAGWPPPPDAYRITPAARWQLTAH
jgi:hypothetical protein